MKVTTDSFLKNLTWDSQDQLLARGMQEGGEEGGGSDPLKFLFMTKSTHYKTEKPNICSIAVSTVI